MESLYNSYNLKSCFVLVEQYGDFKHFMDINSNCLNERKSLCVADFFTKIEKSVNIQAFKSDGISSSTDFEFKDCKILIKKCTDVELTLEKDFDKNKVTYTNSEVCSKQIVKSSSLPPTVCCEICKKHLKRQCYRRHMLLHERPKNVVRKIRTKKSYVCPICNKDCVRKARYLKHQRYHENLKRNPCPKCEETFKHTVALARHISRVHEKIEIGTQCHICKKTFSAITNHLRLHKQSPTQCGICQETLPSYYSYKYHMRYHAFLEKTGRSRVKKLPSYESKEFKCFQCASCFRCPEDLSVHTMSHVVILRHLCPYCHIFQFDSKAELVEHVLSFHTSLPAFHSACLQCFKIVPCAQFASHLYSHTPALFNCEICDKSFSTKPAFTRHFTKMHPKTGNHKKRGLQKFMDKYAIRKPDLTKIPCLFCSQKIFLSNIRTHLKSHQTYKCTMCEKIFFTDNALETHQIRHQREAQRCPICSHSFLSHIRLLAHLKMVHLIAFTSSKACSRCPI